MTINDKKMFQTLEIGTKYFTTDGIFIHFTFRNSEIRAYNAKSVSFIFSF